MNAYQEGREARLLRKKKADNPNFLWTPSWKRWQQGWMDSDKEFAKRKSLPKEEEAP